MSKKIAVAVLGAMVAVGIGAQTVAIKNTTGNLVTAQNKPRRGYEKCYGIVKSEHKCASGSESCGGLAANNQKNAWLGLPAGTCEKIVGGIVAES